MGGGVRMLVDENPRSFSPNVRQTRHFVQQAATSEESRVMIGDKVLEPRSDESGVDVETDVFF